MTDRRVEEPTPTSEEANAIVLNFLREDGTRRAQNFTALACALCTEAGKQHLTSEVCELLKQAKHAGFICCENHTRIFQPTTKGRKFAIAS